MLLVRLTKTAESGGRTLGLHPRCGHVTIVKIVRTMPAATTAIALVERADGKILCVWSKRLGRWTLPTGSGQDADVVKRSLRAQVGANAMVGQLAYEGIIGSKGGGQRALVFSCAIQGEPRETEPGCPVTWFTRAEFLLHGVIPDFYEQVFAAVEAPAALDAADMQCDGCGKSAPGASMLGWLAPPVGWLVAVQEGGKVLLACGRGCVERLEADQVDE